MQGVEKFGTFTKHLSLLPEEIEKISLLHLFKEYVTSSNINKSNILQHNIPTDKEDKYLHKEWIILSIICQKVFNDIAPYWKNLGSTFENYLNGQNVEDDEGLGFTTIMGHLDTRIELDEDVKHEDARYYPALSMMASKLAYENELVIKKTVSRHLKMEYVNFYEGYNAYEKTRTTQALMMREKTEDGKIIVAFRGTSPFDADDWITDIDYSWCKIQGMGKIHKGFLIALGLPKYTREDKDVLGDYHGDFPKQTDEQDQGAYYVIRDQLKEIMASNERANFIVTGHSLGGALAILFPAVLALHGEVELLSKLEAVYTFGQPRVGDENFGMFMKRKLREHNIKYYRIVYGHDIVPWVPFDNTMMTFKHFGTSIHFNSLYHGKIVEEEPIKPFKTQTLLESYFGMLREMVALIMWCMLGRLKAVWELIRGFMIGFTAGPYYREGWLQIGARALGIIAPEFFDHGPQDYLNATLLASQDLFNYYPAMN